MARIALTLLSLALAQLLAFAQLSSAAPDKPLPKGDYSYDCKQCSIGL